MSDLDAVITELTEENQRLKEDFARIKIIIRGALQGNLYERRALVKMYKYALKHGGGIHFSMDEEAELQSENL